MNRTPACSALRSNAGRQYRAPAFANSSFGVTLRRTEASAVEVDPVVDSDNTTIELNIAPEIIYKNEDKVFSTWRTKEAELDVTQPIFYSMKLSTSVSLHVGHPHLAAVLSPRDENGDRDGTRKVLTFIRADLLTVGK